MRLLYLLLVSLLVMLCSIAQGQMMDDFVTTNEDTPITFNVADNDAVFFPQRNTVDLNLYLPGRQTTAYTIEGSYVVNNSADVTFTPSLNFFGTSALRYSMNYGFFGTTVGTATITVTINPVNDPPIAKDDEDVTGEDIPITLKVLSNDEDVDDGIDPGSIVLGNPVGGSFTANDAGEVTYIPTLNFNGIASANYTVQDFAGAVSNKATITIRVNAINDPPVAVNDAASTEEGDPVTLNVIINDTDVDGSINPATVIVNGGTGGIFTANPLGEVTYTPLPGFHGTATANYTVKDNESMVSNGAIITITVNPVNDPPIAANDAATLNEDTPPILINILANDSDPDGTIDPGTVVLSGATNGTFTVNASGIVTYTPPANFYGVATAKYTVKDNEGATSNVATIAVTVNPVNDPPTFDVISNQRVLENSTNKSITVTGISAGPFENETLTLTATSGNPSLVPNPTVTYNGTASTATLTFKPQPNQTGKVTIRVELTDKGGLEFSRTFQIEVVEVEFISEPVTVAVPGQLYEYFIEVTDVSETLSIVATQKPAWATLTPNGKNKAKLSGTPPANAPLSSVVTLQLKDGSTVLDQQQYTLIVNRKPTVTSFGLQTQEDLALQFIRGNFENAYSDPDNQPLAEIQFTKLPKHGTLKLNTTTIIEGDKIAVESISSISYNPDLNYNGLDTLYWKGSDGYSYSQNAANIHFVITPVNDAPFIEFLESTQLQYELGSEIPIKLTSAFKVIDVDDAELMGAEIGIRFLHYQSGKERLIYTDTLGIHGNFNVAAGILVLSGKSLVANYQAAIRSVKYNYVNLEQVTLRTTEIYFSLSDGKNISDSKTRSIELIYTFKDLKIPSAFTPNTGDPINDTWVITSPNNTDRPVPYEDARIRVYNKRGTLVYEATGFENPWDGTFNGCALPVDTYYYTIDLRYNRVRYKGVVTILR